MGGPAADEGAAYDADTPKKINFDGVKALILPILIFQRRNLRPTYACRPPALPLGDT